MQEVTIIIPGLLAHIKDDDSQPCLEQFPALNTLINKAKLQNHDMTYRQYLFKCFELPAKAYAAVIALTYQLPAEQGYWLQLTPVQLMPDMAGVYMLGHDHLTITAEEAQQINADITPLLEHESWQLFPVAADCYLLNLTTAPEITTTPPDEIIGKEIGPFLISGHARHDWLRLQDEIQMQLQALNFNILRQLEGRALVNGIWIWGEGSLPMPANNQWDVVYSDNRLAQGLAELTQTQYKPLTSELNFAKEFCRTSDDKLLIVVEAFNKARHHVDSTSMTQILNQYEEKLFAPLIAAFKAKQIAKVSIYTDTGIYNISAKPWWRIW